MVLDVTEATFQSEVIDRSATLPVVVDFWAEWCGPCRALTPILEREAARREGHVVLAKLDTDAAPNLSRDFQIQGIPAVKAFRDGRVVSEFVGAQPPAVVERFFDALVPSEAEQLAAAGDEASLRRALELEPGREDAAIPLARLLLERGDRADALEVLENVAGSFQADALAARTRLEDAQALADAFAALDSGETERALQLLIDAIPENNGRRDDIRQVVVGVLDELGVDHPLSREYRRRLASALY